MFEKQQQEAGDNSQQIQANTVIINNGIDEKRAREIIDERLQEVISSYSQEAQEIARNRVSDFANDLVPRLIKANLLETLKDPSVQILLGEAQKSAASTERSADYSILSELLMHRVKKGEDRNVRAGVSRAVKIVDEITDEALLALTVAYSVTRWIPTSGNLYEGLRTLDSLFGKIIYADLPTGGEWIEHLDVLDAVRINSFGSFKKTNQYYSEMLSGYVDAGIDMKSENYQKALELIAKADLPNDILCEHELRPGFVRLRIVNLDQMEKLLITSMKSVNTNGKIIVLPTSSPITDVQKVAVKSIYDLYDNNDALKSQNISAFASKWDEYDNLKKLKDWWDDIPQHYIITPVGKVLAHANAQKCDSTLPPLD